jgi:hypothetical protein
MMEKTKLPAGTKLLCVRAPEYGIPLKEGLEYTVRHWVADGHAVFGDGTGPNKGEPGVELTEVPGAFLLNRFEVING